MFEVSIRKKKKTVLLFFFFFYICPHRFGSCVGFLSFGACLPLLYITESPSLHTLLCICPKFKFCLFYCKSEGWKSGCITLIFPWGIKGLESRGNESKAAQFFDHWRLCVFERVCVRDRVSERGWMCCKERRRDLIYEAWAMMDHHKLHSDFQVVAFISILNSAIRSYFTLTHMFKNLSKDHCSWLDDC